MKKWFVWGTERWDRRELARDAMVIDAESHACAMSIFAIKCADKEFYSICAVPLDELLNGEILEFV